MVSSPRSGKTLSPHELVRFLNLLSQTGNFALACSTLGRSKSGLYKRRLRYSLFDRECVAALATFRMENPSLAPLCNEFFDGHPLSLRGHSIEPDSSMEPLRPLRPPEQPHLGERLCKREGAVTRSNPSSCSDLRGACRRAAARRSGRCAPAGRAFVISTRCFGDAAHRRAALGGSNAASRSSAGPPWRGPSRSPRFG